jgi:hypothetical protein
MSAQQHIAQASAALGERSGREERRLIIIRYRVWGRMSTQMTEGQGTDGRVPWEWLDYLIPSAARDRLERFRDPRARSLAALGMR